MSAPAPLQYLLSRKIALRLRRQSTDWLPRCSATR